MSIHFSESFWDVAGFCWRIPWGTAIEWRHLFKLYLHRRSYVLCFVTWRRQFEVLGAWHVAWDWWYNEQSGTDKNYSDLMWFAYVCDKVPGGFLQFPLRQHVRYLSKDVQMRFARWCKSRFGYCHRTSFETRSCDCVSLNIIELSVLLKILHYFMSNYLIVIYLAIK